MKKLLPLIFCAAILAPTALFAAGKDKGLPDLVIPKCFGVNIHFAGPGSYRDAELILNGGFRFARADCRWPWVEPKERGKYDFSATDPMVDSLTAYGVRPMILIVDDNPLYEGRFPTKPESIKAFAKFAAAITSRYKGRGAVYEIWNEPNNQYWAPCPNGEQYVALVRECAKEMKAVDKDTFIIGPAVSGVDLDYLAGCFRAGLLEVVDAVSVHPYAPDWVADPEHSIARYDKARELIKQYAPKGKNIELISGECGYTTTFSPGERQAQMLARMFLTNFMCRIPLSIWYDWLDYTSDPNRMEQNFGAIDYNRKPKLNYIASQTLARTLHGCRLVRRLESRSDEYILLLKGPKGTRFAAWTTGKPREVTVPCEAREVTLVSLLGSRQKAAVTSGKVTLTLTQSAQYVEANPN